MMQRLLCQLIEWGKETKLKFISTRLTMMSMEAVSSTKKNSISVDRKSSLLDPSPLNPSMTNLIGTLSFKPSNLFQSLSLSRKKSMWRNWMKWNQVFLPIKYSMTFKLTPVSELSTTIVYRVVFTPLTNRVPSFLIYRKEDMNRLSESEPKQGISWLSLWFKNLLKLRILRWTTNPFVLFVLQDSWNSSPNSHRSVHQFVFSCYIDVNHVYKSINIREVDILDCTTGEWFRFWVCCCCCHWYCCYFG